MLGIEASGCDINPAAVSFAKVYELINESRSSVLKVLNDVELFVSEYTNNLPIYKQKNVSKFEDALLNKFKQVTDSTENTILLALLTGLDLGNKVLNSKRINDVWGTLRANIENLPSSPKKVTCYQADSRETPLKSSSIDFVVTSPPYINVFNYHQNYRKSIEKTGVDILKVAKSEIGSNRKFRPNRFLTVVQYCMDMSQVFMELRRICKHNAKIIFIVGHESKIKNTSFNNYNLIDSIAKLCGYKMVGKQSRVFINKFGESIYEEILRFNIESSVSDKIIEGARKIGQEALKHSLSYCDQDVKKNIIAALEKSNNIETSPLL